jgi:isopenicillin N synthase-like dioxygenase
MSVPLIDLSAASDAALAGRIDAALREAGFFAVLGHGVSAGVVDGAFDASKRFFALADAEKSRWHIDRWPLKRGFDPIGWQALDVGQPPDVKESFYTGNTSLGPNQWPDEALVPGFRAACEAYSAAMRQVADRLMRLFANALGMASHAFDGYMRDPTCTTRLLHYPPQPATAAPGQIGCGAHTDWGALTLLAQDDAGGLQVQRSDGSWLDTEPVPGALVVNTGDMMPRWTNDRWRSTMHRVINKRSGRDRWSIAYFFDLDPDARIAPLPVCVSADNPARYAPLTAGAHLIEMYRRTTVSAAWAPR